MLQKFFFPVKREFSSYALVPHVNGPVVSLAIGYSSPRIVGVFNTMTRYSDRCITNGRPINEHSLQHWFFLVSCTFPEYTADNFYAQ